MSARPRVGGGALVVASAWSRGHRRGRSLGVGVAQFIVQGTQEPGPGVFVAAQRGELFCGGQEDRLDQILG